MNTLDQLDPILQNKQATIDAALQLFDALEPVSLAFMIGRWRGSEISTHHPMDGLLAASNWYGKEFIDPETVHPLLFLDGQNRIFKVAPDLNAMKMSLNLPFFKHDAMRPVIRLMTSLSQTEASQARLRMMEYRGKVSATMIYDNLPINDSFKKVDDNTVMGVMDFKLVPQPFFFMLQRD
ncbi:DUF4334 domain-containing protein [Nodosilinea sp. LEGE 07088]|uniref:DUF4334 domain-containing protein n=1 Tax=Nodosilinea sp. LEGE 07088 TaxID=2777968 RepID=UPI001881F09D|nr:DUF4334 domain-containing protein [Nodosilinea sp. LEGE 07088]